MTVFDSLGDLPPYRHSWETRRTPHSVVALRATANEADAALVVANYNGRVPATVNIVIDWLTRRQTHGALHDKPLTVIGRAAGVPTVGCGRLVKSTMPVAFPVYAWSRIWGGSVGITVRCMANRSR